MNKIYLCYEFDGIYDTVKEIVDIINNLVVHDNKKAYVSPTITFGLLYDKVDKKLYREYCLSLLKDCDMMIVFDDKSNDIQCSIEKEYCIKNNIPIIRYTDYCK